MRRYLLLMGLLALMLAAHPAEASHFRGAAMVPEIDANGFLTVTTTSFWRKDFVDDQTPVVSGVGMTQQSNTLDQSDARYARVTQVHRSNAALPGAGTYAISAGSCCRVTGNTNGPGGNWSGGNWTMNSSIVWDGANAANPIDFNFGSVQPEVSRLGPYSQNLNATSPDGLILSYNQNLNTGITAQPLGLTIDPVTGQMTIPGGPGGTMTYADHQSQLGADRAFSGNIIASNGSSVEFDWMFDGVDSAVNNSPMVADGMSMGNAGDMFNFIFTTSDPDGDMVTLDALLFGILGGPVLAPIYDALTGMISWDSTGSAFGNYIFQARGSDPGNLTDVGSWTVVLKDPNAGGGGGADPVIPEPTALLVWGGLIGLGLTRMRIRVAQPKDRV